MPVRCVPIVYVDPALACCCREAAAAVVVAFPEVIVLTK